MLVLDPSAAFLSLAAAISAALLAVVLLRPSRANVIPLRPIHSLSTKKPLIGDALEVVKYAHVRHDWFATQCERLGYEPFSLTIPCTPERIVISNQADVDAVLRTQFDQFVKGWLHHDLVRDLLGHGLISTDGEQWYHQRKTAAKFFTAKTLRAMMTHSMQRNMATVYKMLDAKSNAEGAFVNLSLLFRQFTLQTFIEVGVGVEFPVIGNDEPLPFEVAMDAAVPLISRRALLPMVVWKLERWLHIGKEKELAEWISVTRTHAQALITAGLVRATESAAKKTDSTAVRSAIDLFAEHSDEDKLGLRPDDLVDFVLTFVMASRDTSSVTLSWLFYAIHTFSNVHAKIRAELATKLPSLGVGDGDYITTDHIKHLVYLEATIKETLRLYPAGPLIMRQAVDDKLINDTLWIQKGQVVAIPIYTMARNRNVWGPDASEFKPERWIDPTTGELRALAGDRFFSFSSGPRTCIGKELAMLTLRIVTANLLHRYTFELDPRNDGSYISSLTLTMKHELRAKVMRI